MFLIPPQKNVAVDFVTAGVVSKLPMKSSVAKPKKCNFVNNEFYCEHLLGAFSTIFRILRKKFAFILEELRSLRSKPDKVVLEFFIWRNIYFTMLHFLLCIISTLSVPCISESYIKLKIKLNFYFHTSLWYLKRFYEGL